MPQLGNASFVIEYQFYLMSGQKGLDMGVWLQVMSEVAGLFMLPDPTSLVSS